MPRIADMRQSVASSILLRGLFIAGVAALLLLAAFPPAPAGQRFAVDATDADQVFDSFWGVENSDVGALRWSDGRSALRLGMYRDYGMLLLSMPLTAPQYPDAPAVPLTLRMDGRDLSVISVTPTWRTYHLLLKPVGAEWQQMDLRLIGLAPASGTGDERPLGVAVGAVRVAPADDRLWWPALLRCATVALVALLSYGALARRITPLLAGALSLALAALPLAGWYTSPQLMAQLQPTIWDLALAGAAGMSIIWYWPPRDDPARHWAYTALFAPLAVMLALSIALSLGWRIGFDSAIMLYLGWLVERFGYVPFRDFFEQNMPGVYLFNAAVGRIFGYSDLGFRLADQALLLGILGGVALMLRPLGARVALAAALSFGLLYLGAGMYMGLQREAIILLPIILAALAANPATAPSAGGRFYGRAALAGALFGLAATIKPHALIGLPVVILFFALARIPALSLQSARPLALAFVAAGAGAALPPLAVAGYLWVTGALPAFLDLALTYWPIYGRLDGLHRTTGDINYPLYLARGWLAFGGHHLWLLPAVAGVWLALRDQHLARETRLLVWMLVGLAAAYALYPLPAGKFWSYHWLPMLFFLVILAALCFRAVDLRGRLETAAPLLTALVIAIMARPAPELLDQMIGRPVVNAKLERTDMVAAFLSERLQPGDRVQTLDWTGGAIHGALIAEALPATSFVEDFYFYHHLSEPTIQRLRSRFLAEFDAVQPRFVVQVIADDKPWVNGPDTSTEFPELDRRLAVEYQPALSARGVIIYERQSP